MGQKPLFISRSQNVIANSRAEQCWVYLLSILVGYERGNSYRVYIHSQRRIVVSRDVSFHERSNSWKLQSAYPQNDDNRSDVFAGADDENGDLISVAPNSDSTDEITGNPSTQMDTEINIDSVTQYPSLRRSERTSRPPERYAALISQQSRDGQLDSTTPLSFEEATTGAECNEWKRAMKEEFHRIEKKGSWELIPRPQLMKPIKTRWVYAKKKNPSGVVERYKARLVAKGYKQRRGIDYDEIFSPVAKYTSLRFLLALASNEDLQLLQLDVKSAFLNGTLEEVIFIEQPEGFLVKDKRNHVYRLLKALYGLKQVLGHGTK